MTEVVVDVPSSEWMSANRVITNHGHRQRIIDQLHFRVMAAVRLQKVPPLPDPCTVMWTIHYPKGTGQKADPDNSYPTCKAILDGIVQQGLIADDSANHITRRSYERGANTKTKTIALLRDSWKDRPVAVDHETGEVVDDGTDFAVFLTNLAEGASNLELSEALRTVVKAVKETGKPGSITYKLDVKPIDTDMQTVAIRDTISTKTPEFDRPKSLRFYDEDGNLMSEPPNQTALDRYLNRKDD